MPTSNHRFFITFNRLGYISMVFNKKPPSLFLVVTQSPATRHFFQEAASSHDNASLIHAETEFEALDQLKRNPMTCIMIDDTTLDSELIPLCEKMRLLPDHHYTPILIISSRLKKSFVRRVLKAGATDFLRHPLDKDDFFNRLEVAKKIIATESKVAQLSEQLNTVSVEAPSLSKRTILDNRAMRLMNASIESKQSVVLMMLDVDQFEHFSHERKKKIGKPLLQDIEKTLKRLIRKQDLLFHHHQERFILILPETSKRAAHLIAENIQDFFKDSIFSVQNLSFPLTVSIGIAIFNKMGGTKEATFYLNHLLQEAQACLNEAKKSGNKVVSNDHNS